jgi:hypothetical protein
LNQTPSTLVEIERAIGICKSNWNSFPQLKLADTSTWNRLSHLLNRMTLGRGYKCATNVCPKHHQSSFTGSSSQAKQPIQFLQKEKWKETFF